MKIMKKLILFLFLGLAIPSLLFAADQKLSQLGEATSLASSDYMYAAANGVSVKVQVGNVMKSAVTTSANQVIVGTGTNTAAGNPNVTFVGDTLIVPAISTPSGRSTTQTLTFTADNGINWSSIPSSLKNINWQEVDPMQADGINWSSLNNEVQTSGINWSSILNQELQTAGINWASIVNQELQSSGINWTSVNGSSIQDYGINWSSLNHEIGANAINWTAINQEVASGNINWSNINSEVAAGSINWNDLYTMTNDINWGAGMLIGGTRTTLANGAACFKSDGITLGYCSSAVASDGTCTCN